MTEREGRERERRLTLMVNKKKRKGIPFVSNSSSLTIEPKLHVAPKSKVRGLGCLGGVKRY